MKASSERDASIVFNLGLAPTLTCASSTGEPGYCNGCDACKLRYTVSHMKEWLSRAGDLSRRRFVVGLMRRAHSRDLLRHLSGLLAPCLTKDSTYARSRVKPALPTDRLTASNDHALPPSSWEMVQSEVYDWFLSSSYWVKVNFLMQMLSLSDAHTVRAALNFLKNAEPLEEQVVTAKFGDDFESGSQHDTEYDGSYCSEADPNVQLLRSASRAYSSIPDDFSFEERPEGFDPEYDGEDEEEVNRGIGGGSLNVAPPTIPPPPPPPPPPVSDSIVAGDTPAFVTRIPEARIASDVDSLRAEAAAEAASTAAAAAAASMELQVGGVAPSTGAKRPSKSAPPRRVERPSTGQPPQQQQPQQQAQQSQKQRPMTAHAALNSMILTASGDPAFSGASGHIDFIRHLPVHLSKYIVNLLDDKSAKQAAAVSTYWSSIVDEVTKESGMNLQIKEEVMLLQGTLANTVNPRYARDLDVPVPNLERGTHKTRLTEETMVDQRDANGQLFKNECNFEAGFRGISTRNVIMEERNVYCGPYNVLVLFSDEDPQRVTHYSGGNLIAYSDQNRKIHFADVRTGEHVEPSLRGHAGPIRSLLLCETRGFLLSGSYDTSLRRWDIATGKCSKIYRGHMGTVLSIDIYLNTIVSGGADGCAKVWNLEDWKAVRTLKHNSAVSAVAVNENTAVTGDSKGKVKVWDLVNGSLIKKLLGHTGEVTSIKVDHWHILTCSKDCYALLWSAVGNHAQCLGALRHPKPIICSEFQFMRAITASEDGRLRIWNVTTRNCCRIMRGNSRSDPILSLSAVGQRILVNTKTNVLALTFEEVQWDYTLATDSMPPLIRYSSFRDAPVRAQPAGYIRAQRLQVAGAADSRIVWRHETRGRGVAEPDMTDGGAGVTETRSSGRMRQLSLSLNRCASAVSGTSGLFERRVPQPKRLSASSGAVAQHRTAVALAAEATATTAAAQEAPPAAPLLPKQLQPPPERRLSWAFEHPQLPTKQRHRPQSRPGELGLAEMKLRLRAQLRAPEADPPEFVTEIRQALHAAAAERPRAAAAAAAAPKKPLSAPPTVDPRAKIIGERLVRQERRRLAGEGPEDSEEGENNELEDVEILEDDDAAREAAEVHAARSAVRSATAVGFRRVASAGARPRLHSARLRTRIPQAELLRPVVASVQPAAAAAKVTPGTRPSSSSASAGAIQMSKAPMLAATSKGRDLKELLALRRAALRQQQLEHQHQYHSHQQPSSDVSHSPALDPFRQRGHLVLRTLSETAAYVGAIETDYERRRVAAEADVERQQRLRWLRFARSASAVGRRDA